MSAPSGQTTEPTVVSPEEWRQARLALLAQEKELTRQRDAVARGRRDLPWTKLEKNYVFEGPQGSIPLLELFDSRSQLLVYHFMLSPDSHHICDGCALVADHIDAARQHFEHADLSVAVISRAGIDRIEGVRQRMGWCFRWVSAKATSFNVDFGVSFTPDSLVAGHDLYNYDKPVAEPTEAPGCSVFARRGDELYHTYSAYARGVESLVGAFAFLDLVPKGRNEPDRIMQWVRLHDEYEVTGARNCCVPTQ